MIENRVLITGASGYVGTRLANLLLKNKKNFIVNYDISLFGDNHLPANNENYVYVQKDLRDDKSFKEALVNHKINKVIHLACISNDPTFELNNKLSKIINYDCFENLVSLSKQAGVKKFIYASTCSVYGISDSPNVTENHPLLPMTDYNKYKAMCEPILKKYLDDEFFGIIIRPATVCGFSEKMRFDLTVNILTNFAYNKGFIKVLGGEQTRPNVHIDDMCNLYKLLIENKQNINNGEIYNFGVENLKVIEIAKIIQNIFKNRLNKEVEIRIEPSNDKRSYQINSDKIKKDLGFEFNLDVETAVNDMINKFEDLTLQDTFNEKWRNIEVLKKNSNKILNYSK